MKPSFEQPGIRIFQGSATTIPLPDNSARCCVTSPPYWGLRDYGVAPQVWGGDPMCKHDWGDERELNVRGTVGGKSTIDSDQERDGARLQSIRTGQFCKQCNAWLGCLGLEPTPKLFVEHLVLVFREVRRVLTDDGTLWLNLGDSYATGAGKVGDHAGGGAQGRAFRDKYWGKHGEIGLQQMTQPNRLPQEGLKAKDLVGIPWMVAFALRDDGWYLRQDIIWAKPNPMPESVQDRCTKSHEYLFLLSKSERYYFDADAIAEPVTESTIERMSQPTLAEQAGSDRVPGKSNGPMKAVLKRSGKKERKPASARGVPVDTDGKTSGAVAGSIPWEGSTRNKRSVWTVTTKPFAGAHFATFPPDLIEPCIRAGSAPGDLVVDSFNGSGTTGEVCQRWGRQYVGVELNPQYIELSAARFRQPVLFPAGGESSGEAVSA